MSSSIWTPAALSSSARPLRGLCWRVVEAQHQVATLKLVDSLAEQRLLERLIEGTKPPVPPECRHLHYLLFTPFRYGAYPKGSRFRRAGMSEGVFYASESPDTAIAEIAFYRLLFFAESPDTPWPANPPEYTAFAASYRTAKGLDLTKPPFAAHVKLWSHPTNYARSQDVADDARAGAIEVIRYASVRDPGGGANLAILTCRVFTKSEPEQRQTWRIHLGPSGVRAICESPKRGLEFDRAAFAADPRIRALGWERP
jgi:hypothetical protein